MLSDEIIKFLLELSEEEKNALNGQTIVDKKIYTETRDFEIDYQKFLHKNELINIRRHTRFVDFPEHKHNYIEMSYVVQGELVLLNQFIEHEIAETR